MTEASVRALESLRDLRMLQWYVVPLLAIVFYAYTSEIAKARTTGNWNAIFAGLTVFGMDCVNETVNGWILVLSGRSALWTAPGPTALRTMVGWNIEIMFMFALSGLIYFNTLSGDPAKKVLGVPERWFWAAGYSAFCVFVEVLLNLGGHLVWEYPFWNRSFAGVWLIFLFGYFHFYAAAALVIAAKKLRTKLVAVGSMYGLAVVLNVVGLGILGWKY
ncbi:MAG: hypothetical protein HS104_32615 [Polyangiaceae bacterium]|nr:hypothetical protein [Polyangiaceae bacterium]MCE7889539.1 hypothetical protein [Sorangiineae bacterium PRO1]MCL4749230.1 hypothetical protein [Myxococcales bacterium]